MNKIMLTILVVVVACCLGAASDEPSSPDPHGGIDLDCSTCHDSEAWRPANPGPDFDHDDHGFALRAAHGQADCTSCHATLRFAEADSQCASCHLDVHVGELGIDCDRCHGASSFLDRGRMNQMHLATRFPLRGVHRALDCEDCHVPQAQGQLQFVQTASMCVDCHLDDYEQTVAPDHPAAGFPTDCESCHAEIAWNRVRGGFNHDAAFFPIFSGRHKNQWVSCTDCHASLSNFSDFTCLDCHKHDNEAEETARHEGETGFVYDSQACFNCHPRGEGE